MFRAIDWIAKSLRRLEPCKELLPAYCQIAGKQVLVYLVSFDGEDRPPGKKHRHLPHRSSATGVACSYRYSNAQVVLLPRSSQFDQRLDEVFQTVLAIRPSVVEEELNKLARS